MPAKEFLDELNIKMRAKMVRTIAMVEKNGPDLREPYTKHLDDGIFELRAKLGSDVSRILFFFYFGRKIVLTNGFIKKTQKTPIREIQKAKTYREEYLKREVRDYD